MQLHKEPRARLALRPRLFFALDAHTCAHIQTFVASSVGCITGSSLLKFRRIHVLICVRPKSSTARMHSARPANEETRAAANTWLDGICDDCESSSRGGRLGLAGGSGIDTNGDAGLGWALIVSTATSSTEMPRTSEAAAAVGNFLSTAAATIPVSSAVSSSIVKSSSTEAAKTMSDIRSRRTLSVRAIFERRSSRFSVS